MPCTGVIPSTYCCCPPDCIQCYKRIDLNRAGKCIHHPPLNRPAQIVNASIKKTLLQETADQELVVLHDLHSVLAASAPYEINQGIMQELAGAGLQLEAPATTTTVSNAGSCIFAQIQCRLL